jgi:predicted TIM-barrel fold metal-dependent hydrolase
LNFIGVYFSTFPNTAITALNGLAVTIILKEEKKMNRIIDLEHHMGRPERVPSTASKTPSKTDRVWGRDGRLRVRTSPETATSEAHLQFMDEAGIDVAVLTTHSSGPNLDKVREGNDYCAKIVKGNPKRFVGFASASPLAGKPGLDELERAVKKLGMKGVQIYTQTEGRPLDSRELWPFYEKVSELGIPIDVHISAEPLGFDALHAPYGLYYVLARELDICAATMRICLGGVLEDFSDLVFIINHFGGGISAVKERFDAYLSYMDYSIFYREEPLISKPYMEYFNKLYFNMAGREVGLAAVNCALANISPRKLMFGTDWPLNYTSNPQGVRRYIEGIRKLPLPKEDIEGMLGGNAAKLLGI